jgi:YD repeat-containing protein
MIALADPNAGRRLYSYDDAGRLAQKTRADGVSVKYRYEPTTGRLTAKNLITSFEDDVWEVKYHYDAPSGEWDGHGANLVGKLAWVEDAAGREYYGYDARGRLVARRRAVGAGAYDISFGYDSADRRTSVGYPDGSSLSIAYDARGFIGSVGEYLLDRSYTAAGQVESEALGSGIVRAYSYDSRGRLATLVSVDAEGKFIQSLAYEHDPASNVLRIDDRRDLEPSELASQSFEYDDLYRLTKANVSDGGISWSYDVVGNITGRLSTLPEGKFHEPEMLYGDGAGPYALTAAGDKRYDYDVNGNLTNMPGQTLEFDAEDRLVRVAKDDGTTVEMVYDHSGQRKVKRAVGPGGDIDETFYVDPLYEVREGTPYRYVWAGGRRVARVESTTEPDDD